MISVRFATEQDIPFLLVCEEESFSIPWSDRALTEHFSADGSLSLIALDGDVPVGYLLGTVLPPESELYRIGVLRSARRRGIGEVLITRFFSELVLRGAESVYLEVREGNFPARGLYEKVGFQQVGIRKNYYRRPDENAAILVKGLLC